MQTIGAYEAKTHFSQLLDAVERGESVTITRHGVPVAVLVPPCTRAYADASAAIDAWLEFREGITLGEGLSLREMIEEGRL